MIYFAQGIMCKLTYTYNYSIITSPLMISRTYIASFVVLLGSILSIFGAELPYSNEEIVNAISIVLTISGAVWAIVERFSKGDVTWFGKKTTTKKK